MCVCFGANSTLVIMKLKNKSEKLSQRTTLAATLMKLSTYFILRQDTVGPHAIFLSPHAKYVGFPPQHRQKLVTWYCKEVRVVSTLTS